MNPTTLNTTEAQIQIEDVIAYLEEQGWQPISHPNPRIRVFQGEEDDFGNPIQAVLPASMDFPDSQMLLDKVINLLAVLEDKSPEEVVTAIDSANRKEIISECTSLSLDKTAPLVSVGKASTFRIAELKRAIAEYRAKFERRLARYRRYLVAYDRDILNIALRRRARKRVSKQTRAYKLGRSSLSAEEELIVAILDDYIEQENRQLSGSPNPNQARHRMKKELLSPEERQILLILRKMKRSGR